MHWSRQKKKQKQQKQQQQLDNNITYHDDDDRRNACGGGPRQSASVSSSRQQQQSRRRHLERPIPVNGHSPTIVNGTKHTIVVFQERGTLYNKQVLQPNEALCITSSQTGGGGVSGPLGSIFTTENDDHTNDADIIVESDSTNNTNTKRKSSDKSRTNNRKSASRRRGGGNLLSNKLSPRRLVIPNNALFGSYKIHAVIGDERCLPTTKDNVRNIARISAVPAAFVAGCLATAVSAGTLAGPSAALAPLVSGLVVKGVVIDTASIVAGGVIANRTQLITEMVLSKKKQHFMAETGWFRPPTTGRRQRQDDHRFLIVTGGLDDGPLMIEDIPRDQFASIPIVAMKAPIPNNNNKINDRQNDLKNNMSAINHETRGDHDEGGEGVHCSLEDTTIYYLPS